MSDEDCMFNANNHFIFSCYNQLIDETDYDLIATKPCCCTEFNILPDKKLRCASKHCSATYEYNGTLKDWMLIAKEQPTEDFDDDDDDDDDDRKKKDKVKKH